MSILQYSNGNVDDAIAIWPVLPRSTSGFQVLIQLHCLLSIGWWFI